MLTLKNGEKTLLLLHIEIQGYYDKDFAFREHQMRYRIEDKFGMNPAMLAIFTDDNPNFHPKEYVLETWGSTSRITFNTYKVMDNPPSTYKNKDSLVALIMETVYQSTQIKTNTDDTMTMRLFTSTVRKLLSKNYPKEYIGFVISFIQAHVKFANPNNYRKFEQKLKKMDKFQTSTELAEIGRASCRERV